MSVASKRTLWITSILTAVTIFGVHYGQRVESDNMYQGVIKDDARRLQRAADKAAALEKEGFEAPVAAGAGERTREEKEREMRARREDFERSLERRRLLEREQGVSEEGSSS